MPEHECCPCVLELRDEVEVASSLYHTTKEQLARSDAELAALKARTCETCRHCCPDEDHEGGLWCAEWGIGCEDTKFCGVWAERASE